jgi:hypothetical protein
MYEKEEEEASACRNRVNILVLMLLECILCVIAEYQLVRREMLTLIRVYREMQMHFGGAGGRKNSGRNRV